MQLTQFTDYSLRVLMYLAKNQEKLANITEIAKWYGISKPHLVKIVHNLAKLNYVKTIQGKGGGILLSKHPAELNIGQIIKNTEANFHIVECFNEKNNSCRITENCNLKHILHEAIHAFFNVLSHYSLEDLCKNYQFQPINNKEIYNE